MIAFIDDHRGAHGVEPICKVLPIAPSTYHAHVAKRRDPAKRRRRRPLVLDRRTRRLFPFIERIFADAGHQGAKTAAAIAKTGSWKLEIVKRNEPHRFVVLPKRWIVERTPAGISHNRRLARDFERYARSAAAFVRLAMIRIMVKRLTRSAHCSGILTSWIGSKAADGSSARK
jgi:transposase